MKEGRPRMSEDASSHDPDVLIQGYLEDTLTEEQAAAMLHLLQTRPEVADRLLGEISLDAMLRELRGGADKLLVMPPPQAPVESRATSRKTRPRFTLAALSTVAALAACIALAGNWFVREFFPPPLEETTTAAVAVLARGVNLRWEDPARAPSPGAALSPGWLRLKSGLAQIEFYQGARVTLEGPAAFQVVSSSEAFCSAGRLSAQVPPQARGFKIKTPQGTIVDLGTEFGLDLSAAGSAVHVFKGEVQLYAPDAAMRSLKEGQAMTLGNGARPLPADQAAFASMGELDERNAESQRIEFEHWLGQGALRNDDPALLLRFDFQDRRDTRALLNHARRAANVPPGSIVGCEWTDGRWPGKGALEFRNVSDRVRLSLPGEYQDLTLCAWVRVNGLDRAFNSLFMVEGYANGAVHWQFTREGKLRLGVAGRNGAHSTDYDTPAVFTPERFGQWIHLATVYDSAAKEIRHYINGELAARLPVKQTFALRLGLAELGNWNDGGRSDRVPVRHFSGAMQEFALYQRVLTAEEIRRFQ